MGPLSKELPPSSSTATADPHWVPLVPYGGGKGEDCNVTGDTKTIAATSKGNRISVSIHREPSPAMSRICLCIVPGRSKGNSHSAYSTVIAAHSGSVLLQIYSGEGYLEPYVSDYFVYSNAGAADPERPPSLYLLPYCTPTTHAQWPRLDLNATGLLCHGKADFVVAELIKIVDPECKVDGAAMASTTAFELHLFRHGEICVQRPRIINAELLDLDSGALGGSCRCAPRRRASIWADEYHRRGVIVSNVLDESPELRYVPYPVAVANYGFFLCTNARGAMKLVSLSPGRCAHCSCSEHATAVKAWALKTDDMAWVLEETMVDSTDELWALETGVAAGYARVHLVYPVAGCGHHFVPDETSAPSEEEDENTAGKGTSYKGN